MLQPCAWIVASIPRSLAPDVSTTIVMIARRTSSVMIAKNGFVLTAKGIHTVIPVWPSTVVIANKFKAVMNVGKERVAQVPVVSNVANAKRRPVPIVRNPTSAMNATSKFVRTAKMPFAFVVARKRANLFWSRFISLV